MRTAIATVALCGALSLVACGGGSEEPGPERSVAGRVGIVLATAGDDDVRLLADSVHAALEEHDQEAVVQGANGDPARQRQLVETFTSQKARAIVVAPADSGSLRPALDAARRAGIPVFTIGRPVAGAQVTTHVDPDFHAAGVAAAEYVGAFLGLDLHAAVVGPLAAHGSGQLEAGFRSTIAIDTARVYAGAATTDGTREGAAAATVALLEKDPSLDAVFALDRLSALGAMDAAYARRRADLVIVSFGTTPEITAAIGDTGPMRAAIVLRIAEGARLLAEAIDTELGGEPVTPAIRIPVRLVTVDSVKR